MGIKVGNVKQAKFASAAYTDTAAKTLFTIPANAMIVDAKINGTASNATTTGVLTLYSRPIDGSSSAAAFATINAKTTTGTFSNGVLSGIAFARQAKAQTITAIYTETGTAASAGAWTVEVDFV